VPPLASISSFYKFFVMERAALDRRRRAKTSTQLAMRKQPHPPSIGGGVRHHININAKTLRADSARSTVRAEMLVELARSAAERATATAKPEQEPPKARPARRSAMTESDLAKPIAHPVPAAAAATALAWQVQRLFLAAP
jgi:hypothetical protein